MTRNWMKVLEKISERAEKYQESVTLPAFQARDLTRTSPYTFFSLKVFHLLELHRRMKLLDVELETITAFVEKVVEKYREGAISREKASYLASWASTQKKILFIVKKSVLKSINDALLRLKAQDRYFLIFELVDALKTLQVRSTFPLKVKKRLKAYAEITRTDAWKETVNNLPFEELAMTRNLSSLKASESTPHRFNGIITSNSREIIREVRSLASSLVDSKDVDKKSSEIEKEGPWDEKIADELMNTFMVDARSPLPEQFETRTLDEEIERLNLSPEIVSKDLEREIKTIFNEIKQKKHPSSVASNIPSSESSSISESELPLNQETIPSSSTDVNEGSEEEAVSSQSEDFFYGASSIMGNIGEDDAGFNQEKILERLDEIRTAYLNQKVQLKFPLGFRTRGNVMGFLWVNGVFHAVVQLENAPRESILLYILFQNETRQQNTLLDGRVIEDKVRKIISRQLGLSERNAFDEDVLWQFSMEKYLGFLPWEVKSSKQVIFPLSRIESSKESVGIIELKEEDDTYQWIMQHAELKSHTGGFLGYLLGVLATREVREKDMNASVHVVKARNGVREVLSMLRGGIAVSETYMTQFYQRVSRMWNVSLDEAKLPVHQARYLLYFFYSGNRKDMGSCERWLMNRFDVTYQRIIGIRGDSQSSRALTLLS